VGHFSSRKSRSGVRSGRGSWLSRAEGLPARSFPPRFACGEVFWRRTWLERTQLVGIRAETSPTGASPRVRAHGVLRDVFFETCSSGRVLREGRRRVPRGSKIRECRDCLRWEARVAGFARCGGRVGGSIQYLSRMTGCSLPRPPTR